ncbi:MAG: bifunctional riboflavin kinase/FAD synthetase [Bacteroidetes bacterium]|jgi:riboflavin kinase/FMN adenylyltransferase|nr:bifunctional riboflavin kinase/FAD synthetase [Bacteroidota bacterium]
MRVFRGIEELLPIAHAVATIGTFDGVHLGHRSVLDRLGMEAVRLGGESLLITFWPHPRMVLQPDYTDLRLLNTLDEKLELLASTGLDNVLILPFTLDFARTGSHDFVRQILVSTLGVKKVIIGYDHHFGRNREGSYEVLEEFQPIFGYELEAIPAAQIDEINVSSTKIRQALSDGDMARSRVFLGYHYFLQGTVVKGQGLGKNLGFPTANIRVNHPFKLIPKDGVYAAILKVASLQLHGMLNIGFRPTFNGIERSIEIHVFDFQGDLYAEDVRLSFVERLRDEMKFPNAQALVEQLNLDEARARWVLKQASLA